MGNDAHILRFSVLMCVIVLIIPNDLAAASWGPPWFKLLLVDLLFHCSTSHRHILWRCEICHYFFGLTLQPWNFSSPLNIQELRTTSSSRRLKKAFREKYMCIYIYIYIWFICIYIYTYGLYIYIYIWFICIYMMAASGLPVPPPPRMGWVQNLRFSYIFMEPAKTHGIYTVLTSSASETVVFAAFCNTTLYTTTLIVLLLQKQQQLLLLLPLLRTTTYYYVLLRTTTYYYVLLRTTTYYYVLLRTTTYYYVHTYIQTNHKSIQTNSYHT